MSRHQRKKKRQKIGKQKTIKAVHADDTNGPFFVIRENPFADVPQEELINVFIAEGHAHEKKFDESLTKLSSLIRQVNVTHLLSILSAYGLTSWVSETGQTKEKELEMLQPYVELLQALALCIPVQEQSIQPANPQEIQEIWDLLPEVNMHFTLKRLVQIERTKTIQQKAILSLQERLRTHTHFVRNWGYYRKVVAISKRLYEPLDQVFKNEVGVSATDLIKTFEHLMSHVEDSLTKQRQRMKPIFTASTVEEAVNEYFIAFPKLAGTPETLINIFNERQFSLRDVQATLLSHNDLSLIDIFTFTVEDLAADIGVNHSDLQTGLIKLSYRFGELKDNNSELFFLSNPVWTRPLIRLTDNTYFCVMPQVFFSFIFQVFDSLLGSNEKARKLCFKRRSTFLEEEIVRLITTAFPWCYFTRNLKWRNGNDLYEVDLIVKVDSYLLIIESKSGAISGSALRGAPDRTKQHIKELLLEPAMQSDRFANKLLSLQSGEVKDDEILHQLSFDISSVQKIVRLSVTLEDFATIQSNIAGLKDTGWLPANFPFAPTMLLADLEIIFDILDSFAEKIHYLIRRAEIEQHKNYIGDELDLLGLYLDTGFNLGETEFDDMPIMLVSMSKKIDEYFAALDHGYSPEKPKPKLTTWWIDILRYMAERGTKRLAEAAVMLLNVPFDSQVKIQKIFKQIVKRARKNREYIKHNTVIEHPPEWRCEAVCFFVFRGRDMERRRSYMDNIARQVFTQSHAELCVIIGVNIDSDDYPYSVLGVFGRGSKHNN